MKNPTALASIQSGTQPAAGPPREGTAGIGLHPRTNPLLVCLLGMLTAVVALSRVHATSLVIDTFEDGPFSIMNSESTMLFDTQRGGMLGGFRDVGISTARRPTIVTSTLLAGMSVLSFDTGDGPLLGLGAGDILLKWRAMSPMTLQGDDAFVLTLPTLTGTGKVHIGINETGFGTRSTWIPVSGPGDLRIPMDKVDIGSGSLAGVSSIQLVISGVSSDFGFDIAEFQIVPEPSVLILGACGTLAFMRRRRNSRSSSPSL